MIQEELLQKLSDIAHKKDAHEARNDYLLALLAVVKMHYPNEITWAVKEPFIACYSCAEEYPCPTIETIYEELK